MTTSSRSPTSTTRTELEEFVEAPAAFTLRGPGAAFVSDERFVLLGETGAKWTAVQRIRLDGSRADAAVERVRAFMRETGGSIASWWLSERSTPADVEERLLAAGLEAIVDDYLIDGMLLTAPPPPGPAGVVARHVETLEDFVAATELQYEVFDFPAERRRSRDALAGAWELRRSSDASALYAAWVDGRIAGAGWSYFSPRGVLMSGGSTAEWARGRGAYRALVRARWDDAAARGTPALAVQAKNTSAPILRRLGFETECRFRRLQDVALLP
ncbi:MAG: hypothetical protein ABSB24_04190 [Gaiellaceae bacterium]